MLLLAEEGIRGGICHAIHPQTNTKANNKYIKDYNYYKEPLYLNYRNVNNLYGWIGDVKTS